MSRTRVLTFVALASGGLASACFAVTDLDRFEKVPPLPPSNFANLRVTVRGMTSHVNERFEFRVIDASNVIQSRGVIVPLGGPAASFYVEGAVPKQNGPFRFDFYADHDGSGGYDLRPDTFLDHAWRLSLDDQTLDAESDTYTIVFDHNTSFTNLNTPTPATEFGKPSTIHMKSMGAFLGKRVEVRIGDASTRRGVAMYRVPVLAVADFDVTVPGMIETGVTYTIEVSTDDGRGGSVQAFRFEQLATEGGIEASFNPVNTAETPGLAPIEDAKLPQ